MTSEEIDRLTALADSLRDLRDNNHMDDQKVENALTYEINALTDWTIILSIDTTPEQQHEINRTDLKEMAEYYGGWEQLKKVIYDIEGDEAEAAHESFVSDYYGSDKAVTLLEQYQEAHKEKQKLR